MVTELHRRLTEYFANAGKGAGGEGLFAITFTETLPLQDFFNLVDAHFTARQEQKKIAEELASRAHQFRSIQKRLLVNDPL